MATPRIIVVGGGISGLAAAHRLVELSREKRLDLEVILLEAGRRLGGCIRTERIDDFLVEAGPDSFISEKPWALKLCERLGLTSRLISTNSARQSVFVVHRGGLVPLPEGFLLMAPTRLWPVIRTPLFSWRGKLRMALEPLLPRGRGEGDESLASFVRRRFGREVLERVAQPLIGGIYAADPENLSLATTMPRFLEMERSQRSVVLAMRREQKRRRSRPQSGARWSLFLSLAGGMQELVNAIAARLPAGAVRLDSPASSLAWNETTKSWTVTTNSGEKLEAQGVVVATPAYTAAKLVSMLAPELAQELDAISYASTATVSLAYRESDIPNNLAGFGLVAPAVESRKILACTFSSLKYAGRAPQGSVLLRAFIGGASQPYLYEQDDQQMEASVREELAMLLDIRVKPLFCRINRHPRSMPQYHVGHLERVRRIKTHLDKFPGLQLAGNAYRGVGTADCVHSGEDAADNVWKQIFAEEKE
ncbi:MAG: protoporphyrinogen oxidase [Deltaproteobacteria bacterium RIFCSPLOWO2_12_FULL_60_19]|nr:MAG: protoporphyrinogen oxidase [Deltaproteobacteria bacterium RIFCSPLOWO2_12_FULL_60_19]